MFVTGRTAVIGHRVFRQHQTVGPQNLTEAGFFTQRFAANKSPKIARSFGILLTRL